MLALIFNGMLSKFVSQMERMLALIFNGKLPKFAFPKLPKFALPNCKNVVRIVKNALFIKGML